MALPSSGAISISNVNSELGAGTNTMRNLGASEVRSLAGMPSGAIKLSNLYGKSSGYTLIAGQVFPGSNVLLGYSSGQTDGAAGSLSSTAFMGTTINEIITNSFGGSSTIRVYLNGTYSQGFFTSISVYSNGNLAEQKFTSQTTQFLVRNNVTSWVWANNFSFANGGTYSIKFT